MKKIISIALAVMLTVSLLTGCGGGGKDKENGSSGNGEKQSVNVPTLDSIKLGEDYKDLQAEIKILTERTDIADTVYKGYAETFMKMYPGIKVTYESITDYESALNLRLSTGDWGDICNIPTSVAKSELSQYFTVLGDFAKMDETYNFVSEKSFEGKTYGIPNGGNAQGIVYNKRIFKEAGITEFAKTPDEFLEQLKTIKEKTKAIPLYTNFAASWPMGAWDAYIASGATGDAGFKNKTMVHMKNPFSKRDDMTGPYAVYYVLYEAVARKLVEEDPASSDWESSKAMLNRGEIATMVLGSWAAVQCRDIGDHPEDVGYMPFPITVNGKRYGASGGNYAFGINKKASENNQIAAMVYLKWILEESPIYDDEGSIPALKNRKLPDVLADFGEVELLTDEPAEEGEEGLFDDINKESEVGINNNDYPDSEILEAALYGNRTLDELMDEWNQKWSDAQETLGVEIRE